MITGLALLMILGVTETAPVHAVGCLTALTQASSGESPVSEHFVEVECPSRGPAPAFRYDGAQGASRVSRSIAKGDVVPMFPEYGSRQIMPGQKLFLVIQTGNNRIERRVEALQGARPGQRLFVRSDDGNIFAARYEVAP